MTTTNILDDNELEISLVCWLKPWHGLLGSRVTCQGAVEKGTFRLVCRAESQLCDASRTRNTNRTHRPTVHPRWPSVIKRGEQGNPRRKWSFNSNIIKRWIFHFHIWCYRRGTDAWFENPAAVYRDATKRVCNFVRLDWGTTNPFCKLWNIIWFSDLEVLGSDSLGDFQVGAPVLYPGVN